MDIAGEKRNENGKEEESHLIIRQSRTDCILIGTWQSVKLITLIIIHTKINTA